MILRLNTTEMLDWMEVWCFRCEHDHAFSHEDQLDDGCPLLLKMVLGEDVPEFEVRDPDWWRQIPAGVSCSRFQECAQCPPDPPDAERRCGLTRREFFDQIRAEMLAQPVVSESEVS